VDVAVAYSSCIQFDEDIVGAFDVLALSSLLRQGQKTEINTGLRDGHILDFEVEVGSLVDYDARFACLGNFCSVDSIGPVSSIGAAGAVYPVGSVHTICCHDVSGG
jgi:hypothetical protein